MGFADPPPIICDVVHKFWTLKGKLSQNPTIWPLKGTGFRKFSKQKFMHRIARARCARAGLTVYPPKSSKKGRCPLSFSYDRA
jgi:hypothetical protein